MFHLTGRAWCDDPKGANQKTQVRVPIAVFVATLLCLSRATSDTLAEKELSGGAWVAKFPGGRSVEDLENTFRANVKAFQGAFSAAGASIIVVSTCRPRERAYLMHWSWMIVKQNADLIAVGATYNVIHFGDAQKDRTHWSTDGH